MHSYGFGLCIYMITKIWVICVKSFWSLGFINWDIVYESSIGHSKRSHSSWKPHSFIISQFLGPKSGTAAWVPAQAVAALAAECSPRGSAAETSSWLILAVGRIQFLVFIGSKSCFLAGCQLSTSPSSLRFPYSFSRGPSIFKSANLLNPQISLYLSDPFCSPGEFFALG